MHYISLGDHCATALVMRDLGIRDAAYPFDWYTHIDEVSYSVAEFNIQILLTLLDTGNVQEVCELFLANPGNELRFPHETGTVEETAAKYLRRFQRLYDVVSSGEECTFVMVVRNHVFREGGILWDLWETVSNYNKKNRVVLVSGIEQPSVNFPIGLIYEYIPYDMSNYWDEDYTKFRPAVQSRLATLTGMFRTPEILDGP